MINSIQWSAFNTKLINVKEKTISCQDVFREESEQRLPNKVNNISSVPSYYSWRVSAQPDANCCKLIREAILNN